MFQIFNLGELKDGQRCVEYFVEVHWAQNMFQILVSWRAPTWAQDVFQILNILESSIGPKYVSDFHILESSIRAQDVFQILLSWRAPLPGPSIVYSKESQ